MRALFIFLSLFIFATLVALFIKFNNANVVVFYPPYRIDMALTLFIIFQLLFFGILYAGIRLARHFYLVPGKLAALKQRRSEKTTDRALRDALKAWFEGRFGQAEKMAQRVAQSPNYVALAGLIGARAAHKMQKHDVYEAWLQKMSQDSTMLAARLITELEVAVDAHQAHSALQKIEQLRAHGVHHIHAYRLALKAYQQAGQWKEVLRVVKILAKRNALHPVVIAQLQANAYQHQLADVVDRTELLRLMQGVREEDLLEPALASLFSERLYAFSEYQSAAQLLENALRKCWDARLLTSYRKIAPPANHAVLAQQIQQTEKWLAQYPNDCQLLLTIGQLCYQQQLWGKAQHYFETALRQAKQNNEDNRLLTQIYLALAKLADATQQEQLAYTYYKEAALHTSSHVLKI